MKRTLLMAWPGFFLAGLPAVNDFLAAATALKLGHTDFSRGSVVAGARFQHIRLRFRIVVCPIPGVFGHPEVLSKPEVVVRGFRPIESARKTVERF